MQSSEISRIQTGPDHPSVTRKKGQHIVQKSWGHEVWLANSPLYCGKALVIKEGFSSSLHFHVDKTETIAVAEGCLKLKIIENGEEFLSYLYRGDSILITPGLIHQLFAYNGDVTLYEFSTEHFDSDSFRIERGIAPTSNS